MDALIRTLKALADKNRLRIVGLLSHRRLCVCELAYVLKITQPSVSKHLKKLKQAGIIQSEQKGLWTNYFFAPSRKTAAPDMLKLVARLLRAEPQIRTDGITASKSDRKKLCCPNS